MAHTMLSRFIRPVSVAAILLSGMAARAQYVAQTQNGQGNYFSLGGSGSPISLGRAGVTGCASPSCVTGTDNGQATINLGATNPWSFSWGGYDYSSVTVSANGFLVLNRSPTLPDGGASNATNYCYCDGGSPACDESYNNQCTNCGTGTATPAQTCCTVTNACENTGSICGGGCCTDCGPNNGSTVAVLPTVVAGWMEDLDDTTSKGIEYLDGVDSVGNHFLTIDYNGVSTSQISGRNLCASEECCVTTGGFSFDPTCYQNFYQFSITLYQISGTGVIVMSYGNTTYSNEYNGNSQLLPDINPASMGVEDENGNILQPLYCSQDSFNQCTGQNDWPYYTTFFFYDPYPGVPATLTPQSLQVDSTSYTPGTGGQPGTFTFSVSTYVANYGGTDVSGSFDYDVYLAKSPQGSILPSAILTQPGNLCVDGGFPCLGGFTYGVSAGQLPAIADGGYNSGPATIVYPGGTLFVAPGQSFSVPIPPPNDASGQGGLGVYYAQMSFNTGGYVQTTINTTNKIELGPDPQGDYIFNLPATRNSYGAFDFTPVMENIGYVDADGVSFTLYLVGDSACGPGQNPCFAGCLYDGGFNLFAPGVPQVGTYTVNLPANSGQLALSLDGGGQFISLSDAGTCVTGSANGCSITAGLYWVVGYINDPNDINPTNNYFCSQQEMGVYPPHLVVDPGSIQAGGGFSQYTPADVCYLPILDAGIGDGSVPIEDLYPCNVNYAVENNGLEYALGFDVGVYLHAFGRHTTNPFLDSPMVQLPNNYRGAWGPLTLGPNCTVNINMQTVQGVPYVTPTYSPGNCGYMGNDGGPVVGIGYNGDGGVLPTYVQPRAPTFIVTPGNWEVGVYADVFASIPNLRTDTNKAVSAVKTIVDPAYPDLTVTLGDLNPPATATAGEPMQVQRIISNQSGVVPSYPVPYSYFMSAIGLTGTAGVPVPFIIDGGYSYTNTTIPLAFGGQVNTGLPLDDKRPDTLLVPSALGAANYTLSIVIDPDNVSPEISRDNKVQKSTATISVVASPLQIISNTYLPVGVAGQPYEFQLQARGGFYQNVWSVVEGLPAGEGLSLASDGTLSGLPVAPGDYTFVAQVTSGQQSQIAVLILTVTSAAAPIQIIVPSDTLPPATVGEPYSLQLQAQGGVQPYTWSGTPPPNNDFQLTSSGLLSGQPTVPTPKPIPFIVTVTDRLGNQATANLRLQVVTSGQLIITTDPSTCISTNYASCPAAIPLQSVTLGFQSTFFPVETDGLVHTFTWTFPAGQVLPQGVNAVPVSGGTSSPATLVVSGQPRQTGIYPFRVEVADEVQHVSTRHAILVVTGVPLSAGQQTLPDATPGQTYGPVQLVAGSTQSYNWILYSGSLPPGLSLQSDGTISGVLAPACKSTGATTMCTAYQPYTFAAAISDGLGDQAIVPVSINVVGQATGTSGCSTAGGGLSVLALLACGLLLRRRGRGLGGERTWARAAIGAVFGLTTLASGQARAQANLIQSQTGSCTYTVTDGGPAFIDISPAADAGAQLVFPQRTGGGKYIYPTSPELAIFGVRLPFSVPMPGVVTNEFKMQSNGLLIEAQPALIQSAIRDWNACGSFPYTGGSSSAGPAQNCPPPFIALAPWWGDLSLCALPDGGPFASMTYLLPPNGSNAPAIFQWTNASDDDRCTGRPGINNYTFQIQINPDGSIYYVYANAGTQTGDNQLCGCGLGDPPSLCTSCDFAVGAQSGDPFAGYTTNGIGIICNPVCTAPAFPAGQTIALQLNPLINITDFTVGGNATVDGTVTVDLLAQNGGPSNADTQIGFYFSPTPDQCITIDPTNTPLTALGPLDGGIFVGCATPPGQEVRGEVTLSSPQVTATNGYLIAAAIVNGVPTNPACFPLTVGPPEPDYTCDGGLSGVPTASVAPSAGLTLSFNLQNIGAAANTPLPYGYFLSRTPTPTPADFEMGSNHTYPLAMGPGEIDLVTDSITVPANTPPGVYSVGAILNPQNTVSERSTTNNLCLSPVQLTVICAGNPEISNSSTLPVGYTQVQYQAVLSATCGDGTYQWSVAAGTSAPPGLSLATNGIVTGVPTTAGTFPLSVVVTDGQGLQGTASFMVTVNNYTAPLSIVTTGLPSGAVGNPYNSYLAATGGMPPYTWCGPGAACPWAMPGTLNPLQGTLPLGLLLASDGTVTGVPTAGGPYQFQVAVKDSSPTGTPVTSNYFVVNIGEPGRITITSASLPLATVGKYYQSSVTAEGGQAPYSWQVLSTQRTPGGPGDPGATLGAVLPTGLSLDPAAGNLSGTPQVSGAFTIELQATDSATPAESTIDSVFLTIIPANGLEILNTYLPQGTVNAPYNVQLDTNAVDPTSVTFTAVDSAGNPSSAMLPPGVYVSGVGQISGTPTTTGSYAFLVQAQDNQNRLVIQALDLTVVAATKSSGGCSAAPGEFSGGVLIPLFMLLAFWAKRRGKIEANTDRHDHTASRPQRSDTMVRAGSATLAVAAMGLLLSAGNARAQSFASTPGSYVPLGTSGHKINSTDPGNSAEVSGTVTGTDNGVAIMTLGGSTPWTFTYGGNPITQIAVAVDGFISLNPSNCGCSGAGTTDAKPACSAAITACPNNCGPAVAGATGCCTVDNACTTNNNCIAFTSCGGSCCTGCGYGAANVQEPMMQPSMVAAWFEDLDDSQSNGIRYLDGTDELGNNFLTIDYHGVAVSPAAQTNPNECAESCGGGTLYNFSITLYQPSGGGEGIIAINYGPATTPTGNPDTCQVMLGVYDQNYQTIAPEIIENVNFNGNNDCYEYSCQSEVYYGWYYYEGCAYACGGYPSDQTFIYYDTPAPPSSSLLVPSEVQLETASYDAGGGFPNLSFTLGTTINNLGGGTVPDGSISYSVYLSQGAVNGLPTCPLGDLPCLGAFSQPVASGTLPPFTIDGGFQFGSAPGIWMDGGPSVVTPVSLAVSIPPPPLNQQGIYYAQMNFGGGSPVESATSGPLEFGPDPAAVGVSGVPPLPSPDGTFSVSAQIQNIGFVSESYFTYTFYLAKDGCDAGFNAAAAPYLGTFDAGGLDALSTVQSFRVTTLPPTTDAGIVQQGTYSVVVQIQSADDLDKNNNVACSLNQITVSPPNLQVSNVRAPDLCYVTQEDGGTGHYGCEVDYTVTNSGTELALNFYMGIYAHLYDKGPDPNPLVDAKMYYPDDPAQGGEWGPITLGGQCTMTITNTSIAQVVNLSPPGCGSYPTTTPPPVALPQQFPNTTYFGDSHNPVPANYQLGVYADPDGLVPGSPAGRKKGANHPTEVDFSAPDLTVFAGDLTAPTASTAGSPMAVNKIIRNIGPIAGGAPYAYYLSSVGLIGSNGVPVPVLTADGGLEYFPNTGTLQPPSNAGNNLADRDQGVDNLLLPAGLATGSYTLTIAVDPYSVSPEVHRNNKVQTASGPITITASPIQVLDTNLPVGVVGEPYPQIQLAATGGFGAYTWSVIAGDLTASGLNPLSPAGVLSGTPTQAGDYSFAAQVTSGEQSQVIALFLTVATASGPLQITSPSPLPVATAGQYYSQQLQAQGGVPPYTWTGNAPTSLRLDPSGLLVGTPSVPSNGLQTFTVNVSDKVGNQVTGTIGVQVVDSAAITISTDSNCAAELVDGGICLASVPPQTVSQQFSQTFYANEPDGQSHNYSWTFPAGQALPAGVSAPRQSGNNAEMDGTPTQVGIFPFALVATDEQQRTATRHFVIVVQATAFAGGIEQLPSTAPGASYGPVSLTTSGSSTALVWSLYSGELPPVLTVGSNGSISGMVSATAAPRVYSFVAAVETSEGGLSLVPATISVVAPVTPASGCQSGGGELSFVALGLALLFVTRRRRLLGGAVWVGLGLAMVLALAPAARAQIACTYTPQTNPPPSSFNDISTTGTVIKFVNGTAQLVPVPTYNPFPLTLGFTMPAPNVPQGVTSVKINSNGLIGDVGMQHAYDDPSSCGFPYNWGAGAAGVCPEPTLSISPWLGNMGLCYGNANVTYKKSVDANNKNLITFQWTNLTVNQDGTCDSATDNTTPLPSSIEAFTFQAVLHESGDIDFIYQAATNPDGALGGGQFFTGGESGTLNPFVGFGISALNCQGGCVDTQYPGTTALTSISLLNVPNVQIPPGGFTVSSSPALNGPATLGVTLQNYGPQDNTTASISVYYTDAGCPPLGSTYVPSGAPLETISIGDAGIPGCGAPVDFSASVVLSQDAGVQVGAGALIAVVNNGGSNAESWNCQSVAIGPPLADFQATGLSGVNAFPYHPGDQINLTWDLLNNGSSISTPVSWGYYISRTPTPTPFDYQLYLGSINGVPSGNNGLQPNPALSPPLVIPASFSPGKYAIAVIVDPNDEYSETSKQNNTAISNVTLNIVCPGNPGVDASSYDAGTLPQGYAGIFYQGVLTGTCGDGTYTFSLMDAGALPVGLSLGATTGIISGVPNETGTSSFSVQVQDGQSFVGSGNFQITINPYNAPLAIATTALPAANFGEFYSVSLAALGGQPPYQWCGPPATTGALCPWGTASTIQGGLPPGILLSADGVISGIPAAGGSYPFEVQVRDSASTPTTVTSNFYTVSVNAPGRLIVATNSLPVGFLDQTYNTNLAAAGGKTPYSHDPNSDPTSTAGWLVLDTQRLPASVSDYGSDLGPVAPPGLTLDLGGKLSGTPTQAGNFTLLVQVTDSSTPPQVATDIVLLTIVPANGLQILNTVLPQATVHQSYSLQLQTNAQDPKTVVFVPVDSSGHNSPAARDSLPPGITLTSDGLLSGVPSVTGSYPFLVQATDGQGRIVIQAVEITVSQPLSAGGGCATLPGGTASSAPTLALLALVALGLRRSRRRS